MSDTMVSCTGAPQDTVLAPLPFTLYTRHIQKYADDTAIVGCIKDDGVEEYWRLVGGFVAWCRMNHLQLNTSKTKGRSSSFPSAGPAGSRTPLSIVPSQPTTPHWGRGHRVHRTAEGVGGASYTYLCNTCTLRNGHLVQYMRYTYIYTHTHTFFSFLIHSAIT